MIDLSVVRDVVAIFSFVIGLSYYIMNLRNQTKTRHMQIMQNIEGKIAFSPTFDWEFLQATWEDYEDFWEKYGPENNPQTWKNIISWFDGFEFYGVYVREGMLDVRLICLTSGGTFVKSWEKFGPVWQEHRKRIDEPRWYIECEYVYGRMKKYLKQHPELTP